MNSYSIFQNRRKRRRRPRRTETRNGSNETLMRLSAKQKKTLSYFNDNLLCFFLSYLYYYVHSYNSFFYTEKWMWSRERFQNDFFSPYNHMISEVYCDHYLRISQQSCGCMDLKMTQIRCTLIPNLPSISKGFSNEWQMPRLSTHV